MKQVETEVQKVTGITMDVSGLYIFGDVPKAFDNKVYIDWDIEGAAIGSVTIDENDENTFSFRLNAVQCRLLAGILLEASKNIP